MNERDFFGYQYIRPPNYVVAAIIEEWKCYNCPVSILCKRFALDELTVKDIINEVLYSAKWNPKADGVKTIVIMSAV